MQVGLASWMDGSCTPAAPIGLFCPALEPRAHICLDEGWVPQQSVPASVQLSLPSFIQ
jgi:hypothetical protein